MSNITSTASGKVEFGSIYFGKSLNEWIITVNKSISKANDYRVIRINPGKFGYDVMATMLANIFQCLLENNDDIMLFIRNNLDYTPYLNIIHGGFVETYLYWKNFDPVTNSNYTAPKIPIITDFNNNRVTTYYEKLPTDTQEMYTEIFSKIMNLLADIVLSEGLKNLNM